MEQEDTFNASEVVIRVRNPEVRKSNLIKSIDGGVMMESNPMNASNQPVDVNESDGRDKVNHGCSSIDYTLETLDIDVLTPNPDQPRKYFDPEEMSALEASIKAMGVADPIKYIVDNGKKIIVSGERRWRAAQSVGMKTIPALRVKDNEQAQRIALIDNIAQKRLLPLEEALAIQELMNSQGLNQKETGEILAMPKSSLSESLSLIKLPSFVKDEVKNDPRWTAQSLRNLLKLLKGKDEGQQREIYSQEKSKLIGKSLEQQSKVDEKNDVLSSPEVSPQNKKYKQLAKDVESFEKKICKHINKLSSKDSENPYLEEWNEINSKLKILMGKIEKDLTDSQKHG